MGKNNNGFPNKAAKKFDDPNKVDLYSEEEIYEILNEDIDIILDQITKNREHRGKYPKYISNIFCNISSAKYFYEYIKENKDSLDDNEKEALKVIVSQGFKDSITMKYQNQVLENADRNKYFRNSFMMLAKKYYKVANKLNLDSDKCKELVIQTYIEPKYSIKQVVKLFDSSSVSDKKKMKILHELYNKKERFIDAIGATLTVDFNSSDFVHMIYDFVMASNKKKRKKYLEAYAINFKKIKKASFMLKTDFFEKNKRIIKKLIKSDRGYKKAFDINLVKSNKNTPQKKKSSNVKSGEIEKDFNELNQLFKTAISID